MTLAAHVPRMRRPLPGQLVFDAARAAYEAVVETRLNSLPGCPRLGPAARTFQYTFDYVYQALAQHVRLPSRASPVAGLPSHPRPRVVVRFEPAFSGVGWSATVARYPNAFAVGRTLSLCTARMRVVLGHYMATPGRAREVEIEAAFDRTFTADEIAAIDAAAKVECDKLWPPDVVRAKHPKGKRIRADRRRARTPQPHYAEATRGPL